MAENRGKRFEQQVKADFEKIRGVSIDRIHDQTTGFAGSTNVADFIVYRYPFQFYVECKSVHGNTFPLSNLTDNQFKGLYAKSNIPGVYAGVLCWWVDKDITRYIPIEAIKEMKDDDYKSIRFDWDGYFVDGIHYNFPEIEGEKKRVFFNYDMTSFFEGVHSNG